LSGAAVRAFVALELDEELRDRLAGAADRLREHAPGVRWVAADGIHLTLRFLGPSQPAQLERLKPALAAAAGACPPLALGVRGASMFPDKGAPRVLWVGLQTTPALLTLQAACEAAARGAGYAAERRPFRAHLTLGRWRERVARPVLPALDLGSTMLRRLVLFESELRPQGARHTPLEGFALASRA
jgi:2'-5' RNA ligase